MSAPKTFISYSWSDPEHEAFIVRLATELRESGVDVILDKWDLKEGHDAHAFMESMVTDDSVTKVLIVSDRAYVEKTNAREGGVGTEAQIISSKIYAKKDQTKFVAVVLGRDENGAPYLPAYYASRIYIDLSDPSKYSDSFEQLLRWIFDKPAYQKPELGKIPSYLQSESEGVTLATSSRFRRAVDSIRAGRPNSLAMVREYFETVTAELEKFRIVARDEEYDDKIIRSIEEFVPYRNEIVDVMTAIAVYLDSEESRIVVHRFLEGALRYTERPEHVTSFNQWDFDNFYFIIHELFLYAVATYLKYERFESAAFLMSQEYYLAGRSDYGNNVMVTFSAFRKYMHSLEYRNRRLKLRRLSLRADLLHARAKGTAIEFRHLMQADFVLFLRDHLVDQSKQYGHWWPETLLYSFQQHGPFEVFARSKSTRYFERSRLILDITIKDDMEPLLIDFERGTRQMPRWEGSSFSPRSMLGYADIATIA